MWTFRDESFLKIFFAMIPPGSDLSVFIGHSGEGLKPNGLEGATLTEPAQLPSLPEHAL